MFGSNYFSSIYFGEDYFNKVFGETFTASVSDTLGMTDSNYWTMVLERVLSDTLGITDSTSRAISYLRALAESEGFTDSIMSSLQLNRALTDSLGITDILSRMIREGNITISPTSIVVKTPSGKIERIETKNSLKMVSLIGKVIVN